MAVQNHIDIFWPIVWRDMDEPNPNSVSLYIQPQRPLGIAVAVAAYDGDWRAETLDRLQNSRRANIAEMPDLIGAGRKRFQVPRQLVMRVGQNEDTKLGRHSVRCLRPNNA